MTSHNTDPHSGSTVTIGHVIGAAFGRGVANGSVARPASADERFDRRYWVIVAIEAIALFGGMALLNQARPSAIVGWIAFVGGLHFFGLSRIWKSGSTEIIWALSSWRAP